MAEPSYEELKARVAELEKQAGGRRSGELEFRVGEKGGVSVYGLGRFSVLSIMSSGFGSLMLARNCGSFWKTTKLRAG